MSFRRTAINATLPGAATAVAASQTAAPISTVFPITGKGQAILVGIKTTAWTVTNAITLKLQTASMKDDSGNYVWKDATGVTAALASTSSAVVVTELRAGIWNSAQYAAFPLGLNGRIVAVTGVSDTVTVEAVTVLQDNH